MKVLFFLFSFLMINSYAQSTNWWVYFVDKKCNTSPGLSDYAIDKRFKKNIPLDIYDYQICQDYVDSLKKHNIVIRNCSRWLNAISITIDSEDILDTILSYSFVKKIQPLKKIISMKQDLSGDFGNQYRTARMTSSLLYGTSFNQLNMLGGVDLHNQGFLGNDIVIAVFDAGFIGVETLPIFDNLWVNNRILNTYDFVDNDADVFNGSVHGTMVLSTMGGYMLDSLIGSAPEASYMLFRTEDSGSETLIEEDNWASAAEYADSLGVDIINSSLGYTILYDDTLNSHSYMDMDGNSTVITNAADLASSRGILVVNSAGNSGNNDWYYIGAPADADSVLAVGAVNSLGEVASFSSRGPTYDGRIKPNVCAQGVMSVVADQDSTIRFANGTSFAAPIISGLAACLWQTNMSMTNMELLNMIEISSHLFNNPNDSMGYGIPNFYNAYINSLNLSSHKEDIIIYPSPFNVDFSIIYKFQKDSRIDIFNATGVLIYSEIFSQACSSVIITALSNMETGVYFLRLNDANFYPIVKI